MAEMAADDTGVRIEELRLAGFRSFANARLRLDDLTVLVGPNGAGKSTIIDALELLREALVDGLDTALERRGGIGAIVHKRSRAKAEPAIAVRLRVLPRFVQEIADESGLDTGHSSLSSEVDMRYGFRLGLRKGGMGFLVKNEVVRIESGNTICFHRDHEEDKEAGWARDALSLPSLAQQDLPFRVILEALRTSMRCYSFSPTALRAEPPIGAASILSRAGSNLGDVLKHVEQHGDDLAWVIEHLGAVAPGIVGVKSGTAAGRRIVQFFQSNGGKARIRFDIGDMSDGTLRCLATLLALRQRPIPAIVGIDEIESSIHPGALAVLLDAVAASTGRCQVLLASHSPEALSHPAVTAERVRVVQRQAGKSEIFRVSPDAARLSRPPRSVGKLLRSNALFTAEAPDRIEGDFFEGP